MWYPPASRPGPVSVHPAGKGIRSMLQVLRVSNLALIDLLEVDLTGLGAGLVVFTGETGAGKSIILQALHLLAGGRGSSDRVRGDCDRAEIEALFSLGDDQEEARAILREQSLEEGSSCIIRRVLSRKGRSRIYVNDRLVTARLAAGLAENLVSIASQHDHQQLLHVRRHLDILDTFGELRELRQEFGALFRRWQRLSSTLRELQEKEADKEQRRDFLHYQLLEIREAAPRPGEDEELMRERDLLKSSTTLVELARTSHRLLQGQVTEHLAEIRKNMEQAATLDPGVRELAERISSSCFELEDLELGLRSYLESIPMDPARLEEVSARLAQLKQLQRKYGPTLEEVIAFAGGLDRELASLDSLEEEIARLELELEEVSTEALLKAMDLSSRRRDAAAKLAAAMERELDSLGFTGAVFEVAMGEPEGMGLDGVQASGRDRVEFLFSANPGEPVRPLVKVVSGGELSRLMLAMKCLLARRDRVDTVVFDEVDAGIGGQAAESVAAKIDELAGHHQVLCITHLPQIAAHADVHFLVEKKVDQGRTRTTIRRLDDEERIRELARMLAGDAPSEQTLSYARELVERKGTRK